jgi:hypothetical protein
MSAKIILKHEEKEYLLQRTPEDSVARSVLAGALPVGENQPALVVFSCNEQTADAVLQIAERHCGSAWRVMHYQMGQARSSYWFDDRAANRSDGIPRPVNTDGFI